MNRGTVCWINFEPSTPPEFGKIRPAVVISNSEQNRLLPTVVVIPVSSRPPQLWPLRVGIIVKPKVKSFAVIPGIRQVHKLRIKSTLKLLTTEEILNIEEALRVYLGE